jgi:hypothetical protein
MSRRLRTRQPSANRQTLMPSSRRTPKSVLKWKVTRIRGNSAHDYGTVEAANADAAVRKIVAEYQISDPEVLKRLAVRPVAP